MGNQTTPEETFNEFVEDFGGELVSKLFEGNGKRPNNADYFFRNRTVDDIKLVR
jgi:hypothetical protein